MADFDIAYNFDPTSHELRVGVHNESGHILTPVSSSDIIREDFPADACQHDCGCGMEFCNNKENFYYLWLIYDYDTSADRNDDVVRNTRYYEDGDIVLDDMKYLYIFTLHRNNGKLVTKKCKKTSVRVRNGGGGEG
jgi:hypothetical protein